MRCSYSHLDGTSLQAALKNETQQHKQRMTTFLLQYYMQAGALAKITNFKMMPKNV